MRVLAASFDCALNPGTTPHTISAAMSPKSAFYPASLGPTFHGAFFFFFFFFFFPTNIHLHTLSSLDVIFNIKRDWWVRGTGGGGGGGGLELKG